MAESTWSWLAPLLQHGFRILVILVVAIAATAALRRWSPRLKELMVEVIDRRGIDGDEVDQRAQTLLNLVFTTLTTVIWAVALFMVLREAGFDIGPLLAGAGVLGLAIGFGAQSLVKDVINGILVLLENQICVGDVAIVNGKGGVVEQLTLRTVVLRSLDGTVHVFPHGSVSSLSNMTRDFSFYVFEIGVAYKEDTDRVTEVLHELGEELREDEELAPSILEPLEILGVDSFGDSAVVIKARFKTVPLKQWAVGREMNRRIKKRFDELGIEIPFPHLSLYTGSETGAFPVHAGIDKDLVKQAVREVLAEREASPPSPRGPGAEPPGEE